MVLVVGLEEWIMTSAVGQKQISLTLIFVVVVFNQFQIGSRKTKDVIFVETLIYLEFDEKVMLKIM